MRVAVRGRPAMPRPREPHPGYRLRRPAQSGPRRRHRGRRYRIRPDRIDANGPLTIRHSSRLQHIGIRRGHIRQWLPDH
jgi:hypothetical protein